ncbi:Phage Mu protein F like protein [Sulfitobacter pontiacus]|uniref:Phage Mu protein F like protein n=1 Tax=Sulfitobacter pontiacus TaxID=60137 RepID=A0A1H2W6C5_9RHOB|nr:phage minor head protein [Sulfitobacter pontiacus]SDW76130.1 Phage Mu protein F like protein [Sulfitobacter pontiacus]
MADTVRATFRQPFKEQVAAFRLRLGDLVPTSRWDDISKAQHDRAFMVAGAVKADLLADLGAAVDKAISQGTGLEEFRRDFRQIVERRGWHGWTGEGSLKGEAWRTKIIYRTNILTTMAAARHAQHIDGNFKFWVYEHSGAAHPRLDHLSWNGLILPSDHPFWATHYPPNGWGCGCRVRGARTLAGAIRVGGDPSKTLPDDWEAIDPRTGAPTGIDSGWDYAPGATVSDVVLAMKNKVSDLPRQPSIDMIQDWLSGSGFESWAAEPVNSWPLARLTTKDADRFDLVNPVAWLSAETIARQGRRYRDLTPRDYQLAQTVIDRASQNVAKRGNTLIFLQPDPSQPGYVLVLTATVRNGELYLTSFRRLTEAQVKANRRLAPLLRQEG